MRYFGLAVYLKRMLDVLTIFFLIKFTRRPLRFFGLLGTAVAALGGLITLYLGVYRLLGLGPIADRPLLLLGVLLMVLGIQTLSLGLIGEIIIFTHARSLRDYQVDKIIGGPGWEGEG
jgi:Na+/H+ antiporter NhaD/arsenite permease-like protein